MASGGADLEELRIVLIGRTGDGKSSTGNTILGRNAFKVSSSSRSETEISSYETSTRFGKKVVVVDTPGFYDTKLEEREILKEILRAVTFSTPGFNALGFILRPARFSHELIKTMNLFQTWFGETIKKYAVLILTDVNSDEQVQDYLNNPTSDLLELIRWCGNGALPFQNNAENTVKEEQVYALLDVIAHIKQNNNGHFEHIAYTVAEWYARAKSTSESPVSMNSLHLFEKAGLDSNNLKTTHKLELNNFLRDDVDGAKERPETRSSHGQNAGLGKSRTGNLHIIDDSLDQSGIFITESPPPAARRELNSGKGSDEIRTQLPTSMQPMPSPSIKLDDTMQRFKLEQRPNQLSTEFHDPALGRPRSNVNVDPEQKRNVSSGIQGHHRHNKPTSRHTHGGRRRHKQPCTSKDTPNLSEPTLKDRGPSTSGSLVRIENPTESESLSDIERASEWASLSGESNGLLHPDERESFRDSMRNEDTFGSFFNFFERFWQYLKSLFNG